jgi:PTS system nitrogen regulatory IIA component
MDIKDYLSSADVLIDVRAPDKNRLLQELSKRAGLALGLAPALVTEAILKREELGSTGTGEGVAIPHARIADVKKPFGILARLRRGIDFAAIDGKPVDVVFLLLLPAAPAGEQLNALASVARKLRNGEVMATLRGAGDAGEMYRAIA